MPPSKARVSEPQEADKSNNARALIIEGNSNNIQGHEDVFGISQNCEVLQDFDFDVLLQEHAENLEQFEFDFLGFEENGLFDQTTQRNELSGQLPPSNSERLPKARRNLALERESSCIQQDSSPSNGGKKRVSVALICNGKTSLTKSD